MPMHRFGPEAARNKPFQVRAQASLDAAVVAMARGTRVFELSEGHWNDEAKKRLETAYSMIGDGEKTLRTCEKDNVYWMRRSITAAEDLSAGHKISAPDLLWMRPLAGFLPGEESKVIGQTLKVSIARGEAFTAAHIAA